MKALRNPDDVWPHERTFAAMESLEQKLEAWGARIDEVDAPRA